MSLAELMPSVQALPRGEKFRLVQELIAELAQEGEGGTEAVAEYPVWSPHDAHEAAAVLLQLLEQDRQERDEAQAA